MENRNTYILYITIFIVLSAPTVSFFSYVLGVSLPHSFVTASAISKHFGLLLSYAAISFAISRFTLLFLSGGFAALFLAIFEHKTEKKVIARTWKYPLAKIRCLAIINEKRNNILLFFSTLPFNIFANFFFSILVFSSITGGVLFSILMVIVLLVSNAHLMLVSQSVSADGISRLSNELFSGMKKREFQSLDKNQQQKLLKLLIKSELSQKKNWRFFKKELKLLWEVYGQLKSQMHLVVPNFSIVILAISSIYGFSLAEKNLSAPASMVEYNSTSECLILIHENNGFMFFYDQAETGLMISKRDIVSITFSADDCSI